MVGLLAKGLLAKGLLEKASGSVGPGDVCTWSTSNDGPEEILKRLFCTLYSYVRDTSYGLIEF